MTPQEFFWVTGRRANGQVVMDGPHLDEKDADEIAGDLSNAKVHALPTRNHTRAKQLLAGRGAWEEASSNRLHADEPEDLAQGKSVLDHIQGMLARRKKDRDEIDID